MHLCVFIDVRSKTHCMLCFYPCLLHLGVCAQSMERAQHVRILISARREGIGSPLASRTEFGDVLVDVSWKMEWL